MLSTVIFYYAALLVITLSVACDHNQETRFTPEAHSIDNFTPPEDGRLTRAQIETYIEIKSNELEPYFFSEQAPNFLLDRYHLLENEFDWIKEQIIIAGSLNLTRDFDGINTKIVAKLEDTLNRYRDLRDKLDDKQERLIKEKQITKIEKQINQVKNAIAQRRNQPDSVLYNMKLLENYMEQLKQFY